MVDTAEAIRRRSARDRTVLAFFWRLGGSPWPRSRVAELTPPAPTGGPRSCVVRGRVQPREMRLPAAMASICFLTSVCSRALSSLEANPRRRPQARHHARRASGFPPHDGTLTRMDWLFEFDQTARCHRHGDWSGPRNGVRPALRSTLRGRTVRARDADLLDLRNVDLTACRRWSSERSARDSEPSETDAKAARWRLSALSRLQPR